MLSIAWPPTAIAWLAVDKYVQQTIQCLVHSDFTTCDYNQLIRCLTPAEANHFCFSKNDKIERYPIAIHCYRMKSIQCCRFNQYKQTQEFSGALVGSHNALLEPLPDQCGGKRASSSKLKAGERLNLNLQRGFSRVAAGRYFKNFTLLRTTDRRVQLCTEPVH